MFERFTPRARRVIVVAQDAAREMGHPDIRPDHLLVGLSQGEGMAAVAMGQAGVDRAALRERVAASLDGKPSARRALKVPFSREAKKCLELSLREALALGHNYIGTEHLFFGAQNEAAQRDVSLDDLLGVPAVEVTNRLTDLLRGLGGGSSHRSPGLQTAMDRARQDAGAAPVTTGHVLAALVADHDSQAARALSTLGVTSDAVRSALDAVPVADTSDATPAPQRVTITIGDTVLTLNDSGVARVLQGLNADQLRDALKKATGLDDPGRAAG